MKVLFLLISLMAPEAPEEEYAKVLLNDSVICTFYDAQVLAEGDFIREIMAMSSCEKASRRSKFKIEHGISPVTL